MRDITYMIFMGKTHSLPIGHKAFVITQHRSFTLAA